MALNQDDEDLFGPLRAAKSERERDGLGLQGNTPRGTFDFPAPAYGTPTHTTGDSLLGGAVGQQFHSAEDGSSSGGGGP